MTDVSVGGFKINIILRGLNKPQNIKFDHGSLDKEQCNYWNYTPISFIISSMMSLFMNVHLWWLKKYGLKLTLSQLASQGTSQQRRLLCLISNV